MAETDAKPNQGEQLSQYSATAFHPRNGCIYQTVTKTIRVRAVDRDAARILLPIQASQIACEECTVTYQVRDLP